MALGKIKGVEGCGDKSVQLFIDSAGKITGYCFALDKFVPDPLGTMTEEEKQAALKSANKPKDPQEVQEEMQAIANCEHADLSLERGIDRKFCEAFGVKVGLSEVDGKTPKYVLFPATIKGEVTGYYCRLLGKKSMWSIGNVKETEPFGWPLAKKKLKQGVKTVYITEGQYDAMALNKILAMHQKNKSFVIPACISIPNGVNSVNSLRTVLKDLLKFDEVVLCFDDDEVGQRATKEAAKLLPNAKCVTLPGKDANECLLEGKSKDAFNSAVFHKRQLEKSAAVDARTLHEKAKEPPKWGIPWPWKDFNKRTRGLRIGETIYIGAGEKMGKSELVDFLVDWFCTKQGIPTLLVKPEQSTTETYQKVLGKVEGKIFHDPSVEMDYGAFDRAGEALGELYIYDVFQGIEWEKLKSEITLMASYGVQLVIIDPLTNLVDGIDASAKNVELEKIARQASTLAQDLGLSVIFTCHLNTPPQGKSWAEGCPITSAFFAGSRAMAKCCDLMMSFGGNKMVEDEYEKNKRVLSIIEARRFEPAKVTLYWEKTTGLFIEV